jgi:hypothetical protein
MTSVLNLFSNLNDLNKSKSINDYAADFKLQKEDLFSETPALNQGEKFKKYQKKIQNNLEKKIKIFGGLEEIEGFKSNFEGLNIDNLNLSNNGLTIQTNNVIQKNDYSSQQQTIDNLKNEYQKTLSEYQNLVANISGLTSGYLNRVNPNNPYLGKNICLTSGACGYVTNQGLFKSYPSDNNYTYKNTVGKNGCPSSPYIQVSGNIVNGDEKTPGSIINSNPPLIVGTPMMAGQSCGNEGENIFVNSLLDNPSSTYVGCYNDIPPSTDIIFVPIMTPNNSVNNYTCNASSIYLGVNYGFGGWGAGPWAALDKNPNTFWHSEVSAANNYNSSTGVYGGIHNVNYKNSSGQDKNAKGEYIQINLPGVNTSNPTNIPLTKYDIQGRQGCCGNPSGRSPNSWVILGYSSGIWYLVDERINEALNFELRTYSVPNPKPYQSYMFLTTNCGNPGDKTGNRYCVQITQWNLYTSSNYVLNPQSAMNNVGKMTFNQCQTYALTSSNKYFGLQSVDVNGIGNCMISNELSSTQRYGQGKNFKSVALWSSNSIGNGTLASLTRFGTLNVYNSAGQSVFSSNTNWDPNPSNYLGCYNDCYLGRGLPVAITIGSNAGSTYETCSTAAQKGNWKYFGLQFTQPNGTSECWVGNDVTSARSMGKAGNCTTRNNLSVGGGCSNAVYTTDSTSGSFYFLILQDDGNMCVYRGKDPSDWQGTEWCSMTNGQQKSPNPNFTAQKGKTGKNWMSSGTSLAPGEFIGSNNGDIYLIMQSDGNLVLYTNTNTSGCNVSQSSNNKTIGSENINSVYQLDNMGNKNNIGNLAYVDQNAEVHTYPSSNKKGNNKYSLVANGIDSAGNDIPGTAYGNATLEKCEKTCNNIDNCDGFVMNSANNVCWPKTSNFYPNGNIFVNSDRKIFLRDKSPISTPPGVPNKTNNVDTVKFQNYKNGGPFSNEYGLASATSVQKQQLSSLQSKMNLLAGQISSLGGNFGDSSIQAENQAKTNIDGIKDYLNVFKNTNEKINNFSTNVENILSDSDIVVLQKNYEYLFWSILAIGIVLVSMNIVKK